MAALQVEESTQTLILEIWTVQSPLRHSAGCFVLVLYFLTYREVSASSRALASATVRMVTVQSEELLSTLIFGQ